MPVKPQRKSLLTLLSVIFATCFISGCNRYQVTVNEQPVFQPAPLFKTQRIADSALAACINQTIVDQNITKPSQLSTLNCAHAGITSLEGLPVFMQLKVLNLSGNQLTDIKPLLFLPNIEAVSLSENPKLNCHDAQQLIGQVTVQVVAPTHCRTLH